MKLAEALAERSDLQMRLEQINQRLSSNALVQDGEKPAEDPEALLKELDEMSKRLEELICRINLTNATPDENGETITALLAKRDVAVKRVSILRGFLQEASQRIYRARGSEILIRSTVDVRKLQKRLDRESADLRELETRIQGLNWLTELK